MNNLKRIQLPSRFIIVDDDSINNMICKLTINRLSPSAEIITFLNPEVALQYIKDYYNDEKSRLPTVLFLDINMPTISGWEFLQIFNDFSENIKNQFELYMLTASIDISDKEKASSNLYVKDFLSKPLSMNLIQSIF